MDSMIKDIARLVVTQQPPAIWYKDIGGKKDTFMSFDVKLEGALSKDMQWELHLDLFFEDRRRVEDKFQSILKTQHSPASPPIVSCDNREIEFKFRIEKVSKNFMGQKFRVRCYAKPLHPPGFESVDKNYSFSAPALNDIYSNPIDSRSKRPSGRSRSPVPRSKRQRLAPPTAGDNEDMERVISELQRTQEKLSQTQGALSKMVMVLQQCVTRLGAVEAATERTVAAAPAQDSNKPPPLKRQRSKTRVIFRTEDDKDAFFSVMDDGAGDTKIETMPIPSLLRQFSEEYASSKGEYPLLETGQGILPPRISPEDLNQFLDSIPTLPGSLPGVPSIDRMNTPSFGTAPSPSNGDSKLTDGS